MYGDTSRIRARSSALRTASETLRARAAAASARAESCAWSSAAGELLRSRVRSMVADLVHQARNLDAAADALDAHVHAVDEAIARIAAAGQAVLGASPAMAAGLALGTERAAAVLR
ncbi:hypothetical protein ACPPVW_12850 [Leifsonia sp. McL0607]|uniref:hypothetical protein n=1 Tax=Leifsonia sp. McL0607 TaxID=3415672 RepID=UPI003CF59B39